VKRSFDVVVKRCLNVVLKRSLDVVVKRSLDFVFFNTTIIHENQKVDASPQGIAVDKHSVPTKHSPSTVGIHNAPLTTSCEIKGEPNCTNTFTGTSGVDQTITSSTLSNSPEEHCEYLR
jgi:hypothetical protein